MKQLSNTLFLLLTASTWCGFIYLAANDMLPSQRHKAPHLEAQQSTAAAIQESVVKGLPAQLMAPPAVMGPKGYSCTGEIAFDEPARGRDEMTIRYTHSCKGN